MPSVAYLLSMVLGGMAATLKQSGVEKNSEPNRKGHRRGQSVRATSLSASVA